MHLLLDTVGMSCSVELVSSVEPSFTARPVRHRRTLIMAPRPPKASWCMFGRTSVEVVAGFFLKLEPEPSLWGRPCSVMIAVLKLRAFSFGR